MSKAKVRVMRMAMEKTNREIKSVENREPTKKDARKARTNGIYLIIMDDD